MSGCKLFDCVVITLVGSDSLAFPNLGLDGGFSANIMSSIFLELLEKGVLDHEAALSRSNVPFIRLNTISISDNKIGGRMRSVVSEALCSASLGITDAGEYVKFDRTGLVLHSGGIVTDGAVMCQTRENSHCRAGIMLGRQREDVGNDKESVGDAVNVRMRHCSQYRRKGGICVDRMTFE